jgi:hypothetical protein
MRFGQRAGRCPRLRWIMAFGRKRDFEKDAKHLIGYCAEGIKHTSVHV